LSIEALEDRCVPSTFQWVGTSTTSNLWTDAQNWEKLSPTGVFLGHAPPGQGDDLLFIAGQQQLTSVDNLNAAFGTVRFAGAGYTILPGRASILSPIVNLTFTQMTADNPSGSNTIDAPIALPAGGSTVLVGNANAQMNLSGAINDPAGGGVANITKTGAGNLTLNGVNGTYGGVTTVQQGVLTVQTSTALGSSPQVDVRNLATLDLADNVTISQEVTLRGGGFNNTGALRSEAGSNGASVTGKVALADNAVMSPAGLLTLSGQIFSPLAPTALAKGGNGTLMLTGDIANSYGVTEVDSGQLVLDKTAGKTAVPGNLVIGDGVNDGTVLIDTANQTSPSTDVVINSHSGLFLEAADAIHSLTMTDGQMNANAGQLTLNDNVVVDPAPLASELFGNMILGTAPNPTDVVTRTIGVGSGASLTINGTLSSSGKGTVNLVFTGAGTTELEGIADNSYSGSTTVLQGTLELASGAPHGAIPGDLIVDAPGAPAGGANVILTFSNQFAHNLTVNAGGDVEINGETDTIPNLILTGGQVHTDRGVPGDLVTGILTVTGSVTSNPSPTPAEIDGNLSLAAGAVPFNVGQNAPGAQDLVVNAAILDGTLIKNGPGTLVLNGNDINPQVFVNAGTLIINGSQPHTFVTVDGGATLGGTGTVFKIINILANGILSPGAAPNAFGTLNVGSGGVTFDEGSVFQVDLNGAAPASSDQLNVAGVVLLNDALLEVNPVATQNPESFTIVNRTAGISGFLDLQDPVTLAVLNCATTMYSTTAAGNLRSSIPPIRSP
jgi:autotransporter-associated beta strand protein